MVLLQEMVMVLWSGIMVDAAYYENIIAAALGDGIMVGEYYGAATQVLLFFFLFFCFFLKKILIG